VCAVRSNFRETTIFKICVHTNKYAKKKVWGKHMKFKTGITECDRAKRCGIKIKHQKKKRIIKKKCGKWEHEKFIRVGCLRHPADTIVKLQSSRHG